MSETQCGHIFVLQGKSLEILDNLCQLGKDEVKSPLLEDQVGIVGHCGALSVCVNRRLTGNAALTIAARGLRRQMSAPGNFARLQHRRENPQEIGVTYTKMDGSCSSRCLL